MAGLSVTALILGGAAIASADGIVVDGDTVGPINNSNLALGTVCLGNTASASVPIAIQRTNGNASSKVFQNSSTQTVTVVTPPAGVAVTFTKATTSVPSNWNTAANNSFSADTAAATVAVTPTAAGATTATLTFQASGTNRDGDPYVVDDQMTVSFTAQDCDAAPTVTITSPSGPTIEGNTAGGATVLVAATGNDAEDGTLTPTCTPAAGTTFLPLGPATISCTVTDSSEKSATATLAVTVVDTTKPTIAAAADLTVQATNPAGATVTYTQPTATDAVWPESAPTCLPASGTTFGFGTTTVTCTASDGSSNTATSSFKVTVADTTGPVLSLPEAVTVPATSGAGATVTFPATATDAVDGARTVTCSPVSGSTFAVGTTTVSCSSSDTRGNTTTGQFSVTVADADAPMLYLPAFLTLEATGPDGRTVTFAATATDSVDGDVPVACTPASGSLFAVGVTEVSCTATDSSENQATGTFAVSVVDTTPPSLTLPTGMVVEQSGPVGSLVTFSASATDTVSGAVAVSCTPASGSLFAAGVTTVNCSATDAAGNTANGSFDVVVEDTTPPMLVLPEDRTVEATGAAGAAVTFAATAEDAVSGELAVSCSPASGSTFPFGMTSVRCAAVDEAGNDTVGYFVIEVVDTTAPELFLPANPTMEATGPTGATVTYSVSAFDVVDGMVVPDCVPVSGSTFALGTTFVDCTATDEAGNTAEGSFAVIVEDSTPPSLTLPAEVLAEATGAAGAYVTFEVEAIDLVSGELWVLCTPGAGSMFPLGSTSATCSAQDGAGNLAEGSFDVTVLDTTAPEVAVPGDLVVDATQLDGSIVDYGTVTAYDAVDGELETTCSKASSSLFGFGTTTVVCTATDEAGNTGSGSFNVTVRGFTRYGFYQPVDMEGIVNTVKAGSTVPFKFEVYSAAGEVRDVAVVRSFRFSSMSCPSSTPVDEIEQTVTGRTSLRYDTTGDHFIQNWQTPRTPGSCYRVTMTTTDGSSLTALFRLR